MCLNRIQKETWQSASVFKRTSLLDVYGTTAIADKWFCPICIIGNESIMFQLCGFGVFLRKIVNKMSRTQTTGEYLQEFPLCPWWSLMVIKAVSWSPWTSVKNYKWTAVLGMWRQWGLLCAAVELRDPPVSEVLCSHSIYLVSGPCWAIWLRLCAREGSVPFGNILIIHEIQPDKT